ncbi:MAG: DNA polymerase III subunit delta [Peptostreptococcaceae bacterium]|jgi:DNA polymerase-3 subunit delta|nr:DNA polymerase III subunit delta [Peptostreptococcaceae bacterium]
MEYKKFKSDLKEKKSNIYLVYGRETFLIDEVLNISRKLVNEATKDFNYQIIDENNISLDYIKSSIETLPLMDDKRVIIIKDMDVFKGSSKFISKEEEELLLKYLKNIPSETIVIFLSYFKVDKRKKFFKDLKKISKELDCEKLKDDELFSWVKKKFKDNKINIDNSNLIYFIKNQDYIEKDSQKTLYDLENEIKKIKDFVQDDLVNKEIIDKLMPKKSDTDIFKFVDAIGNKNPNLALKSLNDMIDDGKSPLMILAMVSRQFRLILQVKELSSYGYSNKVIGQKLSLHIFVVSKVLKQSSNFSANMILKIINECLEIDYSIKNGIIKDKIALELLISKYC